MVAVLVVRSTTPRDWQDDESALVEETGERTWAAVGRTGAGEARRESELTLRAVIE